MRLSPADWTLTHTSWPATSASGAMRGEIAYLRLDCREALRLQGTTSTALLRVLQPAVSFQTQTNSDRSIQAAPVVPAAPTAQSALMELRRLSGLTWDQLAQLFGSTRRSLHFWASGKPLSAAHEAQLSRLLALMRRLDRGSPQANRALLLGLQPDGSLPFARLVAGCYDAVLAQLGAGTAPQRPRPAPLSASARAARAPYAPEALAGAVQERVHNTDGPTRVPRLARSRA
ncbi:MAG: XRE family transcriptional regulator [Candidatus Tectimicrobiota bacterium]